MNCSMRSANAQWSFRLHAIFLLAVTALCARLAASAALPPTSQPPHCLGARPRSSSDICSGEDVRRFFYRSSTGCKPFGICEDDALAYDQVPEINYFTSLAACQADCMSHVSCPELDGVENATQSSNGYQGWGEMITYTCHEGYSFVDDSNKKRTCQRDGTWSGDVPDCKADCLAPAIQRPLMIQPAKEVFKYGDSIYYTCNGGQHLVGNAHRTCGEDGAWSGTEPTCAAVTQCQQPTLILHGMLSANNPNAITSVGTTITYTCDTGYILIGNQTQECLESGNWSSAQPLCTRMELRSLQGNSNTTSPLITNSTIELQVEQRGLTFTCSLVGLNISEQAPVMWEYYSEVQESYILISGEYINESGVTSQSDSTTPHGVVQMLNDDTSKLYFQKILSSQGEQPGRYRCTAGRFSAFFDFAPTEEQQKEKVAPAVLVGLQPVTRVPLGDTAVFACVFVGYPHPNISWNHDLQPIHNEERMTTVTELISDQLTLTELEIRRLDSVDAGKYSCVGVNEVGNDSRMTTLIALNETLNETLVSDSRRKRSTVCGDSDSDTVTIVGRVKRQPSTDESHSNAFDSYKVRVQRVLTDSPNVHAKRTVRVISIRSSSTPSSRLKPGHSYIFSGKVADSLLVVSRDSIQEHSSALESEVRQC